VSLNRFDIVKRLDKQPPLLGRFNANISAG
jgi:hypothetical protein